MDIEKKTFKCNWETGKSIFIKNMWVDVEFHKKENGFLGKSKSLGGKKNHKGGMLSASIPIDRFNGSSFWVVFDFGMPMYVFFEIETYILGNAIYRATKISRESEVTEDIMNNACYPLSDSRCLKLDFT
ncbi:hypothetical protein COMNV_01639 [Commensalibacter sp. Nvir]|uniref:hypothetical protein n=1 Tax=Commensalibacter sp. Nvir TaxID=3069817 RepID=UPI002D48D7E6|nr:hypothetical protein COMNV_01639 [Commensalibacter sp. Nvir]